MSLDSLIRSEKLPAGFMDTVDRIYRPLAQRVAAWRDGKPLLLGINGGQGTGKSTLSLFLKSLLENEHQLPTAVLSIDDLYLTRGERAEQSRRIHPLLVTRGVPGTHDVDLGMRVIDALMHAEPTTTTALPRFDKAVDDRAPESQWPRFQGRAEVVILEGWCVGATPQQEQDVSEPVNELERLEDGDGTWRRYVNEQLRTSYRSLFDRIDRLFFLRAPDMAAIRRWRGEQERKLHERVAASGGDSTHVMDDAALDRFIHHYQRLTEHQWQALADKADVILELNENQRIERVHGREVSL